jgi:hypothetical protein
MTRLISSPRCSLVSSGLNGHDIRCGDQDAILSFFMHCNSPAAENNAPVDFANYAGFGRSKSDRPATYFPISC